MHVLLLGVTGKVGSRLLPALLAHNHSVVAYVRDPSKLSTHVTSKVSGIVTGSGTDSMAIRDAILSNKCDAVINTAGFAPVFGRGNAFPSIFSSVSKAAQEVKQYRGGLPLRCWFLSGWPLMDSPNRPHLIMDYAPIYHNHKTNYESIRSVQTSQVAWSLFCASKMYPRTEAISYSPPAGFSAQSLDVSADMPVAWSDTLSWVPIFGTHLNIAAQVQNYYAPLEDCVDFIAADLSHGIKSQWIGKRVGVKPRLDNTLR